MIKWFQRHFERFLSSVFVVIKINNRQMYLQLNSKLNWKPPSMFILFITFHNCVDATWLLFKYHKIWSDEFSFCQSIIGCCHNVHNNHRVCLGIVFWNAIVYYNTITFPLATRLTPIVFLTFKNDVMKNRKCFCRYYQFICDYIKRFM